MTAAGLIFSNIHDSGIPELTRLRTMASVPFGCRYRLVDFALSNFVNADIAKVGIITHNNYQSLLDHIGSGKDWDLSRRSGGIKVLPPFITAYENAASRRLYSSRLEALCGVMNFITRCREDYIVLSDCDAVYNVDLREVLRSHADSGADITVVTVNVNPGLVKLDSDTVVVRADDEGRIRDFLEYTADMEQSDSLDISTNIMVVGREYLVRLVNDAMAHGYTSFYRDIMMRRHRHENFRAYRYSGFYRLINSMASYFDASMSLLDPGARQTLFGLSSRPVLTKVRNSPPTRYTADASVTNSLIADGCVIEGRVENSILFRDVHVGEGAVVKDCILLQNTYVADRSELNCVVTDKDVLIREGRRLSGYRTLPFFVGKGMSV